MLAAEVDGFEFICKLCDLAVVNIAEGFEDQCVEPVTDNG